MKLMLNILLVVLFVLVSIVMILVAGADATYFIQHGVHDVVTFPVLIITSIAITCIVYGLHKVDTLIS